MRIVSGKYKGRHIPVRKNFSSRPTTDFAKENLFNVLNNHHDFEDLQVLDLFAGTGSISYEFASRGAIVDLVELDYKSFEFIKETIAHIGITTITPYRADVFKAISKINKLYDIIFADPPYSMNRIEEIPDLIFGTKLLNEEGWLILEHSDKQIFNNHPKFHSIRIYGSVHFSIFTETKKETII